MNSNTTNLLVMGATAFVTEIASTLIPALIKKNSVIIVPAEPNHIPVVQGSESTIEDYVGINESSSLSRVAADAGFDDFTEETESEPWEEMVSQIVENTYKHPPTMLDVLTDADRIAIAEEANDEFASEEGVDDRPPALVNVFTVPSSWNYEYELETRDPEVPYVIHADEYLSDEMGFHQETVTYYEGDNIMATEIEGVPVYNWSEKMGQLRWGHGSKDKNVVYIRNEKMRKEWEVLLHSGSFEIEVQGLHEEGGELKHSLRKFRDD